MQEYFAYSKRMRKFAAQLRKQPQRVIRGVAQSG